MGIENAEDMKWLVVSDHKCLSAFYVSSVVPSIICSVMMRLGVECFLGEERNSIDETEITKLHRLRWLGHVLRVTSNRPPQLAMSADISRIGLEKS